PFPTPTGPRNRYAFAKRPLATVARRNCCASGCPISSASVSTGMGWVPGCDATRDAGGRPARRRRDPLRDTGAARATRAPARARSLQPALRVERSPAFAHFEVQDRTFERAAVAGLSDHLAESDLLPHR